MHELIDTVAWIHLRGRLVLGTRSRGKDLFFIPGGKRHPGESDLDTLVRETHEELTVRLDPDTARHFGTYEAPASPHSPVPRVRMACYTAAFSGEPEPSAEIEEMAWLGYAERFRTPPVDRLVFDELLARGWIEG
ncbi:NUDIX domain-containing protein [Streptomyces sp. XM4193]|uniref:NUDIX hydrolase n=1 Tax=Streptomyces sp. XM4193 TaxID=2929782 RepID=UPI001FFBC1D9|nr:NUDIX domain-containing protein [Streptomyces sp. XM4193]MCK1798107.1 NUDIX domain-containing protein [Streptomyces sp. XM4193]